MREVLNERDFLEIETPYLTRSTPEGARDYLVPARIQPGSFYALPQSPQLFKQLLMIGGFERYYQIARCFRDEDTRADRQPEFTQLDVEMAFVDEDDVIEVMEAVMGAVFEREQFDVPPPPWPRMTFAEAVSRYGIDRPDTRFGLELHDLGEALAGTEFKVFAGALESGGVVRGINAGTRDLARSDLDALTELAKQHGAKGLVWAFVQDEGWRSPIAKFLTEAEIAAVNTHLDAKPGDLLLIVADEVSTAGQTLSALRMELARRFDLIPTGPPRHPVGGRVPGVLLGRGGAALGRGAPPVHRAVRRSERPGAPELARVRPRARRRRDRRRVDPYQPARHPAEGVRAARDRAGGGGGAVRVLPRRAPLRRASARRDRDGHRSDHHRARRRRVDPRRDRVPEGGQRRRSADRRARPGRSRRSCASSACGACSTV